MRIDAHHHLWRYDPDEYAWIDDTKKALQRDFLPEDLKSELDACGVTGVVSVQARQSLAETESLLAWSDTADWMLGVVGWVPLCDPALTESLEAFAGNPKLKGVRHVVQDEPDDRFMRRDDFRRGVGSLASYNLAYDILIYPRQLASAIELVDEFPNQTFVLDHIAKPSIDGDVVDGLWRQQFEALAKRPNVFCKFSGIITEVTAEAWTIDMIRPYWAIALEAYGPHRLMFGSDWPVCLLRGRYGEWFTAVSQLAEELSYQEQQAFWCDTAAAAYQIRL